MFSETVTSHTTIVNRFFFFLILHVRRLANAMVYFRKERNLERWVGFQGTVEFQKPLLYFTVPFVRVSMTVTRKGEQTC